MGVGMNIISSKNTPMSYILTSLYSVFRGSTVVKVLCYKSEGRWFDPSDSDIKSFWSHYGPEVDSTSNRNEYQEHFLGMKAADA